LNDTSTPVTPSFPASVTTGVRKSTPVTPERLNNFAEKMNRLKEQLTAIFPERSQLIEQIVYALVTREHVLVHGVYGTGKSDLVSSVYSCFSTPNIFSIALTKFMSESHVIGVPDPKEMREQGVLHYRREGGILDGELIELDEIFDANSPLLRVMLGILNERIFKRGAQVEKALLHTAIASTNGDPETVIKSAPELAAVIDRFIFIAKVNYLAESSSRRSMYSKFAADVKPTVRIPFEDLLDVSALVVGSEIELDNRFVEVYDLVIQAYRKSQEKTRQVISDRRACKLLKLVRASAVLHGRTEVVFEDIMAVRWGLCTGNDKAQHDAFMAAAKPVIDQAVKERRQSYDEVCAKLLKQYERDIPLFPNEISDESLVKMLRQVNTMLGQVRELKPELPSNEEHKAKLVDRLNDLSRKLNDRLLGH
jgi:MoxR-like ATPase